MPDITWEDMMVEDKMLYNDPRQSINTTAKPSRRSLSATNIMFTTNYLSMTSAIEYRNTADNHPIDYTISTDDIIPPKEKVVYWRLTK